MFKFVLKQRRWWDFLMVMTEKEIKARYKHAFLGFLWMLINPLMQMFMIGFVFRFFVPVKTDNYFLFLFSGLLLWNFFSYTITKNTPMIVHERLLIKKAKFPREAIILSIVFSNLFHLVISVFLLLFAMVVFGKLEHCLWWILLPICLVWITLLTSGLSLLFSSLNVKFRDINFFVQVLIPLWFYGTPIVYTLNLLPEYLRNFFYINPLTGIIEFFRFLLFGTPVTSVILVVSNIFSTLVLLFLGILWFKKESPNFDDWV